MPDDVIIVLTIILILLILLCCRSTAGGTTEYHHEHQAGDKVDQHFQELKLPEKNRTQTANKGQPSQFLLPLNKITRDS